MKRFATSYLSASIVLALSTSALADETEVDNFASAITQGKASLNFRYRYERVEQDGFDEDAEALLLRSRVTLESANWGGFSGLFEVDNVINIGPSDYNSTENDKTEYPVIGDPEGTDINQAYLKYATDGTALTGGRQRIAHGEKRFVGNKPWRQNEQTYDGARITWSPIEALSVDASYVYNINRVVGPDDGAFPADWDGDNVFVIADYSVAENHAFSAFGYVIDVDEQNGYTARQTVNNSSDTYGIEYRGSLDWLDVRASWATQTDGGNSELDYDADYYIVELTAHRWGMDIQLAREVLGADNGVGFATPLANAHRCQGWADRFLRTPEDGIEDTWVSVTGSIGPVSFLGRYHDFQAESSSADLGNEINLQAAWSVTENLTATIKAALFSSDAPERYDDTDKYWVYLQLNL